MGRHTRQKSSAGKTDMSEAASGQDGDDRSDSETVTLATLKQMLEVQESMFRRMFDSVTSSLTVCVDDLVKTVAELKASIEFTQSEVANLKPVLTKLEETNKVIDNTKQSIALHKNKLEYMENQSRRTIFGFRGYRRRSMERHGTRRKARLRRQLEKLLVLIQTSSEHIGSRENQSVNGTLKRICQPNQPAPAQ